MRGSSSTTFNFCLGYIALSSVFFVAVMTIFNKHASGTAMDFTSKATCIAVVVTETVHADSLKDLSLVSFGSHFLFLLACGALITHSNTPRFGKARLSNYHLCFVLSANHILPLPLAWQRKQTPFTVVILPRVMKQDFLPSCSQLEQRESCCTVSLLTMQA